MHDSARTRPATLRAGCALWAHKPWVGSFLPANTPQNRMLEAYGAHFDTVEGNTTFYALPSPSTVSRWAEQVL